MSKYSYLLKKWWFWVIFLLIILSLFNGIWVLLFFATLATLTFAIIKVIKNENRRKYTIILTISAIFLITFSLIRVVQMYNYVINNPEETTANEQKKILSKMSKRKSPLKKTLPRMSKQKNLLKMMYLHPLQLHQIV